MWSDNDIDKAFQRLNPPEPEPTPFPLDAWLRLETELDKAVIERAVRRRLWKFFAAEVAVVMLVGLGWLLWPAGTTRLAEKASKSSSAAAVAVASDAPESDRPTSAKKAATAATAIDAAPRSTGAAATSTAKASDAAAAGKPVLKSAARSAAIAVAPTAAAVPAAASSPFSAAVAAMPGRRRKSAASRLAYQRFAASRHARLTTGRGGAARPERIALQAPAAGAPARQAGGGTAAIAEHPTQHPAAGSLAAPTEAPAKAVVADAASPSQLRRESQSPLLSQAAPATPAGETPAPDAPAASAGTSATAVAALAPAPVRLASTAADALPTPLATTTTVALPLPARQPRFYVGLVAAPDVTTVRFAGVERPLLNLGVLLEYRLTNRLRVSTGVLRANKEYYAHREDYDWSDYPRAQTRSFSWVEGRCTVLDVPLNLRYDAVVQDHARWFGAAGLSSFFMHRENYSYDYLENGVYKAWDLPGLVNANQHLFSILNLSFGYERSLGSHWSVQAEPYAKIPLAGVGAGKVRLTSGGVFFGVKYGF
ncbi:porin family protein [Hymenobacter daeguensis]